MTSVTHPASLISQRDPNILPPAPKRPPPVRKGDIAYIIKNDLRDELEKALEQHPERLTEQTADGKTLLMQLIESKSGSCVALMLDRAPLHVKDRQQKTALHYLCRNENPILVERLLSMGLDPRELDSNGWSALHYAVANNCKANLAVLKKVPDCERYYAPLFQPMQQTPLHIAATVSPEVLQAVLAMTKAIDVKSARSMTALHLAVLGDHAQRNVPLLLDHDADPNVVDDKGRTALALACELDRPHVAKLLLSGKKRIEQGHAKNQARIQAFLHGEVELFRSLLTAESSGLFWGPYKLFDIARALKDRHFIEAFTEKMGLPSEKKPAGSFTKSLFGVMRNPFLFDDIQKKKHLIAKAQDNPEKNSPLHDWVSQQECDLGVLLTKCQESDWKVRNGLGETPFLRCCRKGPLENISQLLEASVLDCTEGDTEGNHALHIALKRGDLLLLATLLPKLTRLINVPNKKGQTVLHMAIQSGLRSFIELLLRAGANPNVANQQGQTALHLLSTSSLEACDYAPLISFIVKKRGDLEAVNGAQKTALEHAFEKGNSLCFSCLLQAGAKPDVLDQEAKTLLVRATEMNLEEKARKLVFYGAVRDCKERPTPLIAACRIGNLSLVQFFLDRKVPTVQNRHSKRANPNRGPGDETPLTATIRNIASLKERKVADDMRPMIQAYEVLRLLLRSGARVNKTIKITRAERATPLVLAVSKKLVEVVKILCEFGVDIDRKPKGGKRPLKVACQNNEVAIAELLIARGAKVKPSLKRNLELSKQMRKTLDQSQVTSSSSQNSIKRQKEKNRDDEYVITDDDLDSYVSQSTVSSEASEMSDVDTREIEALIDTLEELTMPRHTLDVHQDD